MTTRVLRVIIVLAVVISYGGMPGATAVGEALTQFMSSGSGAGSTQTPPVATPSGSSGIEGKIVIGPMCPEARDAKCADRPYRATVIVKRSVGAQGFREFMRVRSNENGHFRVALPPGVYQLVPVSGKKPLPRTSSQTVVVKQNRFTAVVIRYDTGIR